MLIHEKLEALKFIYKHEFRISKEWIEDELDWYDKKEALLDIEEVNMLINMVKNYKLDCKLIEGLCYYVEIRAIKKVINNREKRVFYSL